MLAELRPPATPHAGVIARSLSGHAPGSPELRVGRQSEHGFPQPDYFPGGAEAPHRRTLLRTLCRHV